MTPRPPPRDPPLRTVCATVATDKRVYARLIETASTRWAIRLASDFTACPPAPRRAALVLVNRLQCTLLSGGRVTPYRQLVGSSSLPLVLLGYLIIP